MTTAVEFKLACTVSHEMFERFIETGLFQDSDHDLLYEMIAGNIQFLTEHAQHNISPIWFEKYKAAANLFEKKLYRENKSPLAGDCVYLECKNGRVYEDAIIAYGEDTSGTEGRIIVVTQGCGHLADIHQSAEKSLKMSVSGGYFKGIDVSEINAGKFDFVDRTFWFWADRPKGNGGLYIKRSVPRWHLYAINQDFY